MNLQTIIGFMILTLFLFSCEKEVTLNFEHEPQLCLTSILNPDSIINARLTLSQALNNTNILVPVKNATINLFEENSFVGQLKETENGYYYLELKPKSGKKYNIVVETDEHKTLSAATTIPYSPKILYQKDTIGYTDYLHWAIFNMDVKLFDKIGEDYYWLYETLTLKGRNYGGGCREINAPFVDDFNRTFDPDYDYGYTHFLQIRLTDENFDGQILEFTIPEFLNRDEFQAQYFLSADKHYDKYIKTTLINRMEETSELPFYEPIQVYSNIENGYGIFGSCAITTIVL
jgi:hypothetical protein